MSIIQTKDVKKWFGDFQALKVITMDVAEGEVLVVCGPSGSGKSTFIRFINRLEQHQEGQIIVDGIELTNDLKNIEAIRSEVGMVFQSCSSLLMHLINVDLPEPDGPQITRTSPSATSMLIPFNA